MDNQISGLERKYLLEIPKFKREVGAAQQTMLKGINALETSSYQPIGIALAMIAAVVGSGTFLTFLGAGGYLAAIGGSALVPPAILVTGGAIWIGSSLAATAYILKRYDSDPKGTYHKWYAGWKEGRIGHKEILNELVKEEVTEAVVGDVLRKMTFPDRYELLLDMNRRSNIPTERANYIRAEDNRHTLNNQD